jgi:hypothetical protein
VRRRALAVLAAAALVIAGCSDESEPASDSTSDSTSDGEAPVETGAPDPPLPSEINAVPFGMGQVAALGNLQVTLNGWAEGASSESPTALDITVRNGANEAIELDERVFRLYGADGTSVLASEVTDATMLEGQSAPIRIASGDSVRVVASFETAGWEVAALLLVDASHLGDRNLPGGFVLDEFTVVDTDS